MNKELVNCLVSSDIALVNFGTYKANCEVICRTMDGNVRVYSQDKKPIVVNADSILSAKRKSYIDRKKEPTMINLPLA